MNDTTKKKINKLQCEPYHFFGVLFTGGVDHGIGGIFNTGSLKDSDDIILVKHPCVVKTEGQADNIRIIDKKTFGKIAEFKKETIGGMSAMNDELKTHYVSWAYDTKLVGGDITHD